MIAAATSSMSFGETLSGASTLIAGILSAVVLIWIYFESQREKDRNERRAARHSELIARIDHNSAIARTQYESLEQKFDAQMSVLLSMIKDQGQALRKQGEKIDHFERTVNDINLRLAVVEATKADCGKPDPQSSGGKGKA